MHTQVRTTGFMHLWPTELQSISELLEGLLPDYTVG